jgi:hypothetical protein
VLSDIREKTVMWYYSSTVRGINAMFWWRISATHNTQQVAIQVYRVFAPIVVDHDEAETTVRTGILSHVRIADGGHFQKGASLAAPASCIGYKLLFVGNPCWFFLFFSETTN